MHPSIQKKRHDFLEYKYSDKKVLTRMNRLKVNERCSEFIW